MIEASIVDPHGDYFADALPRLVGLAEYAESRGGDFGRIWSVSKSADGKFRSLDLKDADVRAAVLLGPSAKALFSGSMAKAYPDGEN